MPTVPQKKAKTAAKKAEKSSAPKAAKKSAEPKVANVKSKFALEDGIAIPASTRVGGVSPYPFANMAEGQSFFVAADIDEAFYSDANELAAAKVEECRKIANRLSGASRRFSKNHEGYKFAIRTQTEPTGVRVWRVEA
ncbi:hypothetical protein EKK58_09190 [Candidatus Dependentiae bacterium]|nr:MAG: hypothetical protein EKK58_09190 [Candidatus Dependentiae bacterium]